jgi:hypothetical protein
MAFLIFILKFCKLKYTFRVIITGIEKQPVTNNGHQNSFTKNY